MRMGGVSVVRRGGGVAVINWKGFGGSNMCTVHKSEVELSIFIGSGRKCLKGVTLSVCVCVCAQLV